MSDPVDSVFGALSDPTRRDVMRRLGEGPRTATELAAELPVSRQAVAKHLTVLHAADLVDATRVGRRTEYVLTPEGLAGAMEWMLSVGRQWDARLARLQDRLDDADR